MNPGGEPGWDGPLDVQVPDDARDLERDVLAYRRELRALRRRRRLRRLMPSHAGILPLMASVLAVCLVAGMMLFVFTISPAEGPSKPGARTTHPAPSHPASGQPSHSPQPTHTPRLSPSTLP